ncbi:MAG: tRNA glutamyl-Q(34) synthetase GluQRS [Betaproteobacteria bacterium]|nr:tRNA glutamyl-Q(34) synthetase GluQRS [Betaproteobacteria bacterium]
MNKKSQLFYRGRFAPSPTGKMHLGSLVTALASFIETRQNHGQWIIRIEDIDTERCHAIFASHIIDTLNGYGLISDEDILYQSQRLDYYLESLTELKNKGLVYPCSCNRAQRQAFKSQDCPCLKDKNPSNQRLSWRLHIDTVSSQFRDVNQLCSTHLGIEERIIIYRNDGKVSYDLAVCVDDALQQINHVVRGADLFHHTFVQRFIQEQLGYPEPIYRHIPVVLDERGQKLSKQNLAKPIDCSFACLSAALQHLGIADPTIHFTNTLAGSINNIINHTHLFQLNA